MNLIIALLALVLLSDNTRLMPDQQKLYSADIKQGSVNLRVKGVSGDLDCYLLAHGPRGWIIVASDEKAGSKCDLSYYSEQPRTLRIWLANHSDQPMSYSMTLTQE